MTRGRQQSDAEKSLRWAIAAEREGKVATALVHTMAALHHLGEQSLDLKADLAAIGAALLKESQ